MNSDKLEDLKLDLEICYDLKPFYNTLSNNKTVECKLQKLNKRISELESEIKLLEENYE